MSDFATYNFAYLDEQTKRMIRRAILKAIAIPGYQVPFAAREMPMPYGWGTGGVQVTAACLVPEDRLKVIDQGADDTTNAVIKLGQEHGFTVDVWDPPNSSGGWWGPGSPGQPALTLPSTPFTSAEDLSKYATILFASPVDNTNSLNPATPRLLNDSALRARLVATARERVVAYAVPCVAERYDKLFRELPT